MTQLEKDVNALLNNIEYDEVLFFEYDTETRRAFLINDVILYKDYTNYFVKDLVVYKISEVDKNNITEDKVALLTLQENISSVESDE